MTARRELDWQDCRDIVRRQAHWICAPILAALVAGIAIAYVWPDAYVSTASIRVVPPQVPEHFVPANTNLDLDARVNSLVQLTLNRATLTNIIHTHNLYQRRLARLALDDVIERMRRDDIKVVPVQPSLAQSGNSRRYPTFEIRFTYSDRFVAQKVATDIVARFLEENVREVSRETVSTTEFLRDQWTAAKTKVDNLEQELSLFRARNLGRLPEEQPANNQHLAALESEKLNLNLSQNRATEERLLIENQLQIYREQLASLRDPNAHEAAVERKSGKLAEKDREIADLENQLGAARQRYTETHPDVQRIQAAIAAARAERTAILAEDEAQPAPAPVERAADPQYLKEKRELTALIERTGGLAAAKALELDDYRRQSLQLDAAIQKYQGRIDSLPGGIKEYDQLIRDRDLAKKDYEDLDSRLNSSAMSTALLNRQQGERLEQLDPPTLPQTPASPKRGLMIMGAAALGLALGLGLAALRELSDRSLKSARDIQACAQLPILGGISLVEDTGRRRRRFLRMKLAWLSACLVGSLIATGSVAHYYVTKS